jgi:NAD(P)-dependent dehydrogenase (short-subunit alcohol dehydrogenase family)
MTDHTTRTALITGASRGLGLALARRLATEGWTLIIDARGAEALGAAGSELAELTHVVSIPGDVTDAEHRRELAEAAREAGGLDVLVNNASILGPSPQPSLLDYPIDALEEVYRANTIAPLALIQAVRNELKPGARILNITSDAGVEPYEGWGGYGPSKAALEHLSAILAAENPELRVYWVDPGDMRTQMHQEAFPGEDISDRPLPDESVPGLLELIGGDLPSGRYRAGELGPEAHDDPGGVREVRVALTVDDVDEAAALYGEALNLPMVKEWAAPEGRGIIFAGGLSTIEVLDRTQAGHVDRIEAGARVSGPVRLAFEVSDVRVSAGFLQERGAKILNEPVSTPWGDLNQRLQTPDGVQLTLFQPLTEKAADTEVV